MGILLTRIWRLFNHQALKSKGPMISRGVTKCHEWRMTPEESTDFPGQHYGSGRGSSTCGTFQPLGLVRLPRSLPRSLPALSAK